jgi:superfamily I DNA/RNA helicase
MKYVAIPQPTCDWLLSHPLILTSLHSAIVSNEINALARSEFIQGPLRMMGTDDQGVLAVWNRDYLSGTGEESWGIFRLEGPVGLKSVPEISQQVFERIVFVVNQRLQGYVLDSDLIHRAWENGSHTCLAGRGSESRRYSICYTEGAPGFAGLTDRSIICIGPEHDFDRLQDEIATVLKLLAPLCKKANQILEIQRRGPILEFPDFQALRDSLAPSQNRPPLSDVTIAAEFRESFDSGQTPYETRYWSYDKWIQSNALNEAQRRILESDALQKHPVRVIGPAGSGKTLLMQLLAMRYLISAQRKAANTSILYVVHNSAMAQMVADRFRTLGAEEFMTSSSQALDVITLASYGQGRVGIPDSMVIDKDAQKTKQFQLEQVRASLREILGINQEAVANKSRLLTQVSKSDDLFSIFSLLIMAEISSAIKGRGLIDDERRYVGAEAPLSRLHRILNTFERKIVYDCFRRYNQVVFEEYELLDSDDVAISLLGRLRTPIWQLKRKTEGFDFVFIDEAQLFNENERRIFPFLSKGTTPHAPIVLALDAAQEPFGFSSAGLAAVGIADIEDKELPSTHRSTQEIIDLAFFVIQQTTDLFGPDFPDFKRVEVGLSASQKVLAAPPVIVECNEDAKNFGRFVVKTVQKLRAKNVRQIAVICHGETYWEEMRQEFLASQLPLHVLVQRGEKLTPDQPLVVLSRPNLIGGQEFDAVVLVGLEQGLVPPRIADNAALAAAIEQQVMREMYLSITRARTRLIVAINQGSMPNSIIEGAKAQSLISYGTIS